MKPTALFLGSTYAGHATRFANLKANVAADDRLRPKFRHITGWNPEGRLEKLPGIPRGIKGRLRAMIEARHLVSLPKPDVIWTSGGEELAPYFPFQQGPLRRPLVYDLDATDAQIEAMAPSYFSRKPKSGFRRWQAVAQDRALYSQVEVFLPWSKWARQGLIEQGVAEQKIRVIPPGVDLSAWSPARRDTSSDRPLRMLFIGGDFERKGGDMLLEVAARQQSFELALVTRGQSGPLPPGVRLVRAGPNAQPLMDLAAWADIFVLPTRAECFGIATVEAMAAGLPTIVSDVGASSEIVVHGKTGWLVEPSVESLEGALALALAQRHRLTAMGGAARERAEQLFDGRRNDERIVDTLLELVATRAQGRRVRESAASTQ